MSLNIYLVFICFNIGGVQHYTNKTIGKKNFHYEVAGQGHYVFEDKELCNFPKSLPNGSSITWINKTDQKLICYE